MMGGGPRRIAGTQAFKLVPLMLLVVWSCMKGSPVDGLQTQLEGTLTLPDLILKHTVKLLSVQRFMHIIIHESMISTNA